MIRRSTLVVLIVLAALVGFSFYLKNKQASQALRPTPTEGSSPVFPTTDGSPTDIKIQAAAGDTVDFGRDQSGTWVVKAPLAVAADQAGSEAAASQVTGLRNLSNVQLGLDVVGLDKPVDTMTVTFSSGKTHTLQIGSVTPIQNGYYCQLDGGPVIVVDKLGMDPLLGLLSSPPYLATLTPTVTASPLPTMTFTPAPPTSTPAPSLPAGSGTVPPGASLTPSPATEAPTVTPTP